MATIDRDWLVDDPAEARTVAAKRCLHEQLERDIEEFLAKGGKIHHLAPHESAYTPNFGQGDGMVSMDN